jgi:hypothetical protein
MIAAMMNRMPFSFLWVLCTAAVAQTQYGTANVPQTSVKTRPPNACPWLTQGSAARALGGDVSVTVNVSEAGEGSCKFDRQQGSSGSLQILVSKAPLPACTAENTKLVGVGNEAESCRPPGTRGEAVEMVSSRVRDLHFTVTLTSREQKTSAKSPDPKDDALEQIAEQVAGNLY